MATDAKALLMKFRADLRDLKSNFGEVQKVVDSFNKVLAKDRESNRKQIRDSLQEALKGEQAKQAAIKTTAEQERLKQQVQRTESEILKNNLLERRQETLEIQKQIAQLRLKAAEESNANRKNRGGGGGGDGSERGFLGNVMRSLSGVAGGGLTGDLFSAALMGGGMVAAGEALAETIGRMAEKMKDFIVESGKIQQVKETFEKLAARTGNDPVGYFDQLRTATHGLVGQLDLYRIASNAMQGNMKLSQAEVVKLTGLTVDLARAHGKDATQAVQRLERALLTGRTQMLAMATGVPVAEMRLKGLGSGFSAAEKAAAQAHQTIKIFQQNLDKMGGAPALTFTERLQQIKVSTNELFEATAEGFAKSQGMNQALGMFGKLADMIDKAAKYGTKLGDSLGNIFGTFIITAKEVINLLGDIAKAINEIASPEKKQNASPDWLSSTYERLTSIKGLVFTLYNIWLTFDGFVRKTGLYWKNLFYEVKELATSSPGKWGDIYAKYGMKQEAGESAIEGSINQRGLAMQKMLSTSPDKNVSGLGKGGPSNSENAAESLKLLQLQVKLEKDRADLLFKIKQEELAKEREALDSNLKDSKISLAEYVEAHKKLNFEEYSDTIDRIQSTTDGQKKVLKAQYESKKLTKAEYDKELADLEIKEQEQVVTAMTKVDKEYYDDDKKLQQDKLQAKRTTLEGERKLEVDALQDKKKINETEYSQGLVSFEDYMDSRKTFIDQEKQLAIKSANDKYDISDKGERAKAQLYYDVLQAMAKADSEFTDLQMTEEQKRLNDLEKSYSQRKNLATAQLQRAKSSTPSEGADQTSQILSGLIIDNNTYVLQLQNMLAAVKPFSDEWFKIKTTMEQVVAQTREYDNELRKSKDFFGGVGSSGVLGQFSSLAKLPGLGGLQSVLQTLGSRSSAGPGSIFGDLFGSIKNMSSSPNTIDSKGDVQSGGFSFRNLFDNFGKFSDSLANGTKLITNFVQASAQPQGGVMGAISGAISGAGIGKDLGAGLGKMFPKLGKMAGPIGEAAGAAFGAVLSGIMGSKMQRAQDMLRDLTNKFNDVTQAVKDGTISLADGIRQLQSIRESTYSEMQNSKKKSKAMYQSAIDSMNQQIKALQDQQAKLMSDLVKQVEILGAPLGMQDSLNSLDQIIEKYKQFQGAAATATDLANANNFLALSLRNFAQSTGKELSDAEQQAIQDAIKLNDLYVQRQDILNTFAQTQRDIMTEGVQIYQRTNAQTKMEKLQAATYDRDVQLQKINQEIALTQAKVTAESQIFQLATTRIGLETQLLQLQEAQVGMDMQRIASLSALVNAFSNIPMTQLMKMFSSTAGTTFGAGDTFAQLLKSMGIQTASSSTPLSTVLEQEYWYQLLLRSQQGGGFFGITGP
jgi:hypothetical protein